MYEMDDVMIFGECQTTKTHKTGKRRLRIVSDSASRASSRGGRDSLNSSRRYKKRTKGVYGETGSDHGFEQETFSSGIMRGEKGIHMNTNPSNNGLAMASSLTTQLVSEPIEEDVPKAGQKADADSLIQKMNNLMHQTASLPNMQKRIKD